LIVSWQLIIFLREGAWYALPLSSVFNRLENGHGEIYLAASRDKNESSHLPNLADLLLQVPVIVPVLFAMALLTAFYLWLSNTEQRYSGH